VRSPRKPPTARRSRLAARASSLRCLRRRGTTSGRPLSVPPRFCLLGKALSIGWLVCTSRLAPLAAFPLRVARDRPFRACGRSPHRPRPFRAKMNLVSTPALHPFGSSGPRLRRPRRTWLRRGERGMRWPLAPGGGRRAVLVGGHLMQARSRSRPRGRSRRRERERADGSVGRCRRKTAM